MSNNFDGMVWSGAKWLKSSSWDKISFWKAGETKCLMGFSKFLYYGPSTWLIEIRNTQKWKEIHSFQFWQSNSGAFIYLLVTAARHKSTNVFRLVNIGGEPIWSMLAEKYQYDGDGSSRGEAETLFTSQQSYQRVTSARKYVWGNVIAFS